MSSRKVRHNGQMVKWSSFFSRSKKYKYNKQGQLEEVTSSNPLADDEFKLTGSKSSLRRMADLERNVSLLITKLNTTDGDSDEDSDNWDNNINKTTRFTSDVMLGNSSSDDIDVYGHLDIKNGLTLGSGAQEVFRDLVGGMVSGSETGITVTHNDSGNTLSFSVTSAPKWSTARTISLGGDLSGSVSIDGSGDVTLTAAVGNDSHTHDTRYYTKSQTDTAISNAVTNVIDGAPGALDTLNELAAALGDDSNFAGTMTTNLAGKLSLSGGTMSGDLNMGGNDITNAGTINGTATSAKYADLAERYAADAPYAEGTVVVFGGEAEVTASTSYAQRSVAGVVSTKPAVMMNAEAGNSQTHPFIALQGRVPVKVTGEVKKGDILVASNIAGTATAWDNDNADPRMTAYVGIAISDAVDGFVEVKVGK